MNLKKFEVALERTSKNARAIGDQNLKFVSGELHKTSESFTATVDREPQKFEEVLERTSKNARAIGDQNLKFVSGGDLQPTSEDCSPLSLAQDAETRCRTGWRSWMSWKVGGCLSEKMLVLRRAARMLCACMYILI